MCLVHAQVRILPSALIIMKITYFVHGTTTDNERHISTGWSHGELSELGKRQTKELKETIKDRKFDVVFCSDLRRASDSAYLMFDDSVKIIQDQRLRECNYGDLNGASSDVVEPMMYECIDKPFPNGESYRDVEKRIRNFLEYLLNEYSEENIAIVSHKAPQLALDVIIKGKTWEQAMKEDWRLKKAWQPGWDYNLQ